MKRRIEEALPKFTGYNEFFWSLPDIRRCIPVSRLGRDRLAAIIDQIDGYPGKVIGWVKRDWKNSARVVGFRENVDGSFLARLDVKGRMDEENPDSPFRSGFMDLCLLFDANDELLRYTMMFDGLFQRGSVMVEVYDQKIVRYVGENEFADEIARFGNDDFVIVTDKRDRCPFFQAWCHVVDGRQLFYVEYSLRCWSWQFAAADMMDARELSRIFGILLEGGIPSIQTAVEWRQMYITEAYMRQEQGQEEEGKDGENCFGCPT